MVKQTEIDGVPTLFAPMPGPMTAGLVFRVGRADESLASSGITHLIEHLALHGHAPTDYHFNGATGSVHTHFVIQGSESEVVGYLNGVCASLGELPMSRLETEKAILRTEENGRARGANESMPGWRYGAVGYGLVTYPEWGLHRLRPEDVLHWARAWFTRDNAVLWLTGDGIPAGLRLALPAGRRMPVPIATSALPATPAYFAEGANRVVFDTVVRHRAAASVFAGVLERELFRSLRQEGGYSYTATAEYERRGDGYATVSALADALADKQDAVLGGFIDVLAKLRLGRIDEADTSAVRAKQEAGFAHPHVEAATLPRFAMNLLTGQPNPSLDELRAVTVEDVCAVAVEAASAALLQVPEGLTADWAGLAAAPCWSSGAVAGNPYPSRSDPAHTMVIGDQGASIVTPHGTVTVPFSHCVAMLSWPDGGRHLVGTDGMVLRVEPTLYQVDPQTVRYLDSRVHPRAVIWMPARRPEAIPRPAGTGTGGSGTGGSGTGGSGAGGSGATDRLGAGGREKGGVLEMVTLVVLSVVLVLLVCTGGLLTVGAGTDKTADAGLWVVVAVFWCLVAVVALPLVVIGRRVRRRRTAR